jgi:hypothetical protein
MMVRSDRPTVPPSFDVDKYAKDSDARIAPVKALPVFDELDSEPTAQPQSETRLATRPQIAAAVSDEAWGQSMVGALTIVMLPEELKQLPLDHRAGFLLSLMDESIDLETLIEVSAMRRGDALRIVRDLYQSGVVEFR